MKEGRVQRKYGKKGRVKEVRKVMYVYTYVLPECNGLQPQAASVPLPCLRETQRWEEERKVKTYVDNRCFLLYIKWHRCRKTLATLLKVHCDQVERKLVTVPWVDSVLNNVNIKTPPPVSG